MESFITFFTQFLGKHLSKEGVIFLISVFPVLELRGGLIAASLLKVPFLKGLLISLIGNVLPIPFVLLFFFQNSYFAGKVLLHKTAGRMVSREGG